MLSMKVREWGKKAKNKFGKLCLTNCQSEISHDMPRPPKCVPVQFNSFLVSISLFDLSLTFRKRDGTTQFTLKSLSKLVRINQKNNRIGRFRWRVERDDTSMIKIKFRVLCFMFHSLFSCFLNSISQCIVFAVSIHSFGPCNMLLKKD